MKHYLLSVITPTGGQQPPPEVPGPIMERVEAVNRDCNTAGAWAGALWAVPAG